MLKTAMPVMTNPIEVTQMDLIKVAATSRASAVAGAIAGVVREHRPVEIRAIGAGAVNQAVKALAIASIFLQDDKIALTCLPQFLEIQLDGQTRTALCFTVKATY